MLILGMPFLMEADQVMLHPCALWACDHTHSWYTIQGWANEI